jgi:hypothetical protein
MLSTVPPPGPAKESTMKRTLFSLACLLVLSATIGGFSAQAGDGSATSAAGTTGSDGDRPRSPLIKADLQALKAARKQLKDDRGNNDVDRLTADREAVKAAFKKLREDIAALRKDHKPDA